MIKWQEAFKINIGHIDEQHQYLFEVANKIHELLILPTYIDRYDEIIQLVNQLKEYTKFHFAEEEKLMQEMGYNKIFSHKIMHQDFIKKIESIDLYAMDENQTGWLLDLLDYVMRWITEHIMKVDKYVGIWYQEKNQSS